jgi:hypothetical protein
MHYSSILLFILAAFSTVYAQEESSVGFPSHTLITKITPNNVLPHSPQQQKPKAPKPPPKPPPTSQPQKPPPPPPTPAPASSAGRIPQKVQIQAQVQGVPQQLAQLVEREEKET